MRIQPWQEVQRWQGPLRAELPLAPAACWGEEDAGSVEEGAVGALRRSQKRDLCGKI